MDVFNLCSTTARPPRAEIDDSPRSSMSNSSHLEVTRNERVRNLLVSPALQAAVAQVSRSLQATRQMIEEERARRVAAEQLVADLQVRSSTWIVC